MILPHTGQVQDSNSLAILLSLYFFEEFKETVKFVAFFFHEGVELLVCVFSANMAC